MILTNLIKKNKTESKKIEKKLIKHRRQVYKYYKEGYDLGELCRIFYLDISSILFLLRKSKLKKKKLYFIFEHQNNHINKNKDIITEKDKHLIEKFFPHFKSSELIGSYYWYWKEKYKKAEEKKQNCKHVIRHIRCGNCNKILKDASNILIDN